MKNTVVHTLALTLGILLLGVFWTLHVPPHSSEPWPATELERHAAAMLLAQHPDMKRILIVGHGLAIAETLSMSDSLEAVDWIPLEPIYPELHIDAQFRHITESLKPWLVEHPGSYDAILINLPTPWHPLFSDYTTEEVFDLARESLTINGMLAVGLPEQEFYWAAVVQQTLAQAFPQTLVVGDEGLWLLSARRVHLETIARRLRLRFERLDNAAQICDPLVLNDIYDYERSQQCQWIMNQIPGASINIDPQQTLWQARQVRWWQACGDKKLSVLQAVQRIRPAVVMGGMALALFLCQAVVRLQGRRKQGGWSIQIGRLEALLLPLSGGLVAGMVLAEHLSASTVESLIWTLSLFLLGIGVGILRMRSWARHPNKSAMWIWILLNMVIVIQCGLVPLDFGMLSWLHMFFSGLFLGIYVMAGILEERQTHGDWTSASLGIVLGLLIWSLLTPQVTIVTWGSLALVLGLRFLALIPQRAPSVDRSIARASLGMILATTVLSVLLMDHIGRWSQREQDDRGPEAVARRLVGDRHLLACQTTLSDGATLDYWEVTQGLQSKGYVFASEDLCETVYGYGGPMELMAYVDPEGNLLDYQLTRSYETPRYLDSIRGWMEALKGKIVFGDVVLADVDSVSGATFSTRAIRALLIQSGQRFSQEVLQWDDGPQLAQPSPWQRVVRDQRVIVLLIVFLLALVVMRWDRHGLRMAWLALIVTVMGVGLNLQYSTDHVMPLLHGDWPVWQQGLSWLLVLGIPLIILLLGNLYCGYLCPFGALQELLNKLIPRRCQPGRTAQRWASLIKYVILTVWSVAYLFTEDKAVYRHDPLLGFFDTSPKETLSPWVGLLLVAVLIFPRFWCRTLCPTGAFLSLFNLGAWLRRWLPVKKFGQCEFGLTGRDHLDCIGCDRCRHRQTALAPPQKNKWPDLVYLGLAIGLAIWLLLS